MLRSSAFLLILCSSAFAAGPTVADANKFIEDAEARLLALNIDSGRADWIKDTYITDDTEAMAAQADERAIAVQVDLVKQSQRFSGLPLPPDLARKIHLLQVSLTMATPADPARSAEITRIVAAMEGAYGKGKYCKAGKCLDLDELSDILSSNRNPAELTDTWTGWHAIAPPLRPQYKRFVELSNQGARELGFADTGALWRARYDMPPDQFAAELERLWQQLRPLYLSLHAYVRKRLRERYGADLVPAHGPIPAELLGNMWAQDWSDIYPLVAPKESGSGYDLTKILKERKTDPLQMVHYGERFFESLGFSPLPESFWQRSLFVKPRDRDVVCHASAWDIDFADDLRLKMCIEINEDDFRTIHHELGHNFYQRAYKNQPFLFRDSANDGVHEAIGDTIALSVTPEYLVKIGLLDHTPDASGEIGRLLAKALEKVAFLPFGYMIDKWRWDVFSGRISPEHYNQSWWDMKLQYQGVAPPSPRSEADFDPAAKYHVAANVPYARYFVADILQFQFHRALARIAGCNEPLNRCSIYDNKEAGRRLNAMLEMGESRPWQEAVGSLTGIQKMDASAMLEYFAPLQKWLDQQNQGDQLGW
ncbi:MAG TPA: M2 family metallopeptidase [Bryobacteraceae bacterium]|jgi:peptidyl-dipeptidase A